MKQLRLFFALFIGIPTFTFAQTKGLKDYYKDYFSIGADRKDYLLLFDQNIQPKKAFEAVVKF